MVKHENESTYMCIDYTPISERTFSVPLGFGGYLLTVDSGLSRVQRKMQNLM